LCFFLCGVLMRQSIDLCASLILDWPTQAFPRLSNLLLRHHSLYGGDLLCCESPNSFTDLVTGELRLSLSGQKDQNNSDSKDHSISCWGGGGGMDSNLIPLGTIGFQDRAGNPSGSLLRIVKQSLALTGFPSSVGFPISSMT